MTTTDIDPVVATVRVAVPLERAWSTFTTRIGAWWPTATHSIGEHDVVAVVLEDGVDGRLFERLTDGTEHLWGGVTVWEPPDRLAFWWRPTLNTTREPTHVEVCFTAIDGATELKLTHTGWEVLGADAERMRIGYVEGWPLVLQHFMEATAT
jgi:Activator of Hsp90 ATPase homolog 1-like protein